MSSIPPFPPSPIPFDIFSLGLKGEKGREGSESLWNPPFLLWCVLKGEDFLCPEGGFDNVVFPPNLLRRSRVTKKMREAYK